MFNRSPRYVAKVLRRHFDLPSLDKLVTTSRKFPLTTRVDLQVALERYLDTELKATAYGLNNGFEHYGLSVSNFTIEGEQGGRLGPLQYDEIDIGEDRPARCITNGIWLSPRGVDPFAVIVTQSEMFCSSPHVRVELAVRPEAAKGELASSFFLRLEEQIARAGTYRGKIISLEADPNYSGTTGGIKVHRLPGIPRENIILPARTLELLERNVIGFIKQRPALRELGLPLKKGLLFYGPPGTGKTHTIKYLADALTDHTTMLITAEQMVLLSEYFQLARFMQPSIIVMEDVDLIAQSREQIPSVCEQTILNKLLNEMDGLRQDVETFFILTTNRPEQLEAALASRPGRIDQAIEFPQPDDECRKKLVRLYAAGLEIPDETVQLIAGRTDRCSAAFIKELMRRAAQHYLEAGRDGGIQAGQVDSALEEMLFTGGSLNRKLLGGATDECGFHS